MDRTLVLLRHAKADRPNGVADVDRPLTERGHADSAAAGAWLVKHGHVPDLVLCSPSKRTRQTWHSVAVALAGTGSPDVHYERAVYDGSAGELLKVVQSAPGTARVVMLIGHNPTISHLSQLLDPDSELDSDGLRTCGIAVHRVSSDDWASVQSAPLTTVHTARALS
ncbi:SixA phosphatase family protein [Allorhizocola rhizosphaerae]|uniref:SixA phosphatase family protein n=1 Tax=Allorhizocola rhizosphaerae TaxID=1872709 RepID=UPI000E3CF55F|nr:histidine phosphatase family protein [Allorhizocola rhizosphaerae]